MFRLMIRYADLILCVLADQDATGEVGGAKLEALAVIAADGRSSQAVQVPRCESRAPRCPLEFACAPK